MFEPWFEFGLESSFTQHPLFLCLEGFHLIVNSIKLQYSFLPNSEQTAIVVLVRNWVDEDVLF